MMKVLPLPSLLLRQGLLLGLFWLLPFQQTGQSHPFYVGVTELHITPGGLELSVRLFTDDLEAALDAFGEQAGIDLIRQQPEARIDSLLPAYFTAKMTLLANNNRLKCTYIGYEIEMDACWVHLEAKLNPAVERISIDLQLLYELFPSQQHIVHLLQGGVRKSTRLDKEAGAWEVKLPI